MERAVAAAARAARPGETVLLSPAAKSFDQYADFEARGDHFRALGQRWWLTTSMLLPSGSSAKAA